MSSIIISKNICFGYPNSRTLFSDISISIGDGDLITLLGPNGVGKSTFLNCICGLLKPQNGKVYLMNKDITRMGRNEIAKYIAYVPQKVEIFFDFTVKEFVVMGRTAHLGILSLPNKSDYEQVNDALYKLGILDLAERSMTELSGGEQQKVCIARAIVQKPKLIILDEPTSALDFGNQIKVLKLVKELSQTGYAILMTTHNPDHCLMLCENVAIIDENGKMELGQYNNILTEKRLTSIYKTKVKIMYSEEIGRWLCVPEGLKLS